MSWIDIACIVFVCVTVNHLGLVAAIQQKIGKELLVVNCPKCLTFWATMVYGCDTVTTYGTFITVLAISFLASYGALWLELLEGYIDTLYLKLYDKIYNSAADTSATDPDKGYSAGTVPEL